MWKVAIGAGLMAAGLAACDSIEGAFDDDAFDEFDERADLNEALATEVASLPETTADDMPVEGTATFEGYAGIIMGVEADTALVGDASITADFGESTIDGTLGDFVGTVEDSDAERFEGELALDDGLIGVGGANGLVADLEGTLTDEDGDDEVAISGGLTGDFRSDGGRGATALLGVSDPTTDFVLNGEEVGGTMSVVAD